MVQKQNRYANISNLLDTALQVQFIIARIGYHCTPRPYNMFGRAVNYIEQISYVFTMRLIGPISYPGECDLMVCPRKHIVIFSRMHLLTFVRVYNMHQDTKSARLIAVCKRTFTFLADTNTLMK